MIFILHRMLNILYSIIINKQYLLLLMEKYVSKYETVKALNKK